MGWKEAMKDKSEEYREYINELTDNEIIQKLALKGAMRFNDEVFSTAVKKAGVSTPSDLLSWGEIKDRALRFKTGSKSSPKKALLNKIMVCAEEQGLLSSELAVAVATAGTQEGLLKVAVDFGIALED